MPEAPTVLHLRCSRCDIVVPLRRVFPDLRGSRLSVHTKGAIDTALLEIRYYGCLIVALYHRSRTHLSLDKDAPETRPAQDLQAGRITQIREVGGLHHRYERRAA